MNQIRAMERSLDRAIEHGMPDIDFEVEGQSFAHLQSMLNRAREGALDNSFSDAKIGRWLGWLQAMIVAADIGLTLEDMKEINRQAEED